MRPRCRAGGTILAVFEILRARGAGEDVIARIVFVRARLVVRAARFMNSWLVTPMGLVDVTSRFRGGRKLDKHSK